MRIMHALAIGFVLATVALGVSTVSAAGKKKGETHEVALTDEGRKLEARYAQMLKDLQAEIAKALPVVDPKKKDALLKAHEAATTAATAAGTAQQSADKVAAAKGLVEHAKGKWIKGAEKGIAQAEAALKKATTDAEREAAKKELSKWQANKDDGIKALKERQEALDKALADQAKSSQADQAAKSANTQTQNDETRAAKALISDLQPFLTSNALDAKLVKCTVLAQATPNGLAAFAQQGKEQADLVDKLLGDDELMKQMLIAGGAEGGKYGQAMQIYTAIQNASPNAAKGLFKRLALGVSLEHAVPVKQTNADSDDENKKPAKDAKESLVNVDPVKRYLHYEKAYRSGELDPAFENFSAWEYRMVVNCNAPDDILTWGRQMLRTYRPDHIYTSNYGWRYSASVKTEVPYGSQNVKNDLPTLHQYQNIIKDGGVCGRRAFFGRFMLKSFGIPTWGVTQHKHAALSHWTPKGWVINLGAGFQFSWWDKEDVPMSGTEFLLETHARAVPKDYMEVLRAQWVGHVLGEQAYNERKHITGGLWSNLAHYKATMIATDSKAVELGPLGAELAEANEAKEDQKIEAAKVTDDDTKVGVGQRGVITIPAVAHGKTVGRAGAMKSFSGGMQLFCSGGFKADYTVNVPSAGKYSLAVRVASVKEDQNFLIQPNDAKDALKIAVPFTIGLWQQTQPVEVSLAAGQNVLHFTVQDGNHGVTIKEFTLAPVK